MATRRQSSSQGLRSAAARLRDGGLVVFPTETYYGLAACASNSAAVERVASLKARDHRPIPLIASSLAVVREWVVLPEVFELLVDALWPGPLTVAARPLRPCPPTLMGGGTTVGIRVSSHELARRLAFLAGGVITATSANPAGAAPVVGTDELEATWLGGVDEVLEGGLCAGGPPSTVVGLDDSRVILLRAGAVSSDVLAGILGYAPAQAGQA